MQEENAAYLNVILRGQYSERYLAAQGQAAPKFTVDELRIIAAPVDFVGLNIYHPAYVRADASAAGYARVADPVTFPHMQSDWLTVGPEALYWGPTLAARVWGIKRLYITENGASSADVVMPNGEIYDIDRVMYLRMTSHSCNARCRRVSPSGVTSCGACSTISSGRTVTAGALASATWISRRKADRKAQCQILSGGHYPQRRRVTFGISARTGHFTILGNINPDQQFTGGSQSTDRSPPQSAVAQ